MSARKKILMLGGSAQQIPAIKAAKEMGYETILIDYLPDNPGQYVVDKWYGESTTDIEKVYQIAKTENVSGILAYASDPAALPAAVVSERLGLPTNPAKSVEILGVKHKFRSFLKENGFNVPSFYVFNPETPMEDIRTSILALHFPIVIKPTDSSGSKGVTFLTEMSEISELERACQHAIQYSGNQTLIAEEFIERGYPNVIGGDIFVVNGKVVLKGDMDCWRDFNGTGLIPIGKKYPVGLTSVQRETMYSEIQRLIELMGIISGEFNIELIIDKANKPHFLEMGPRAGGNMIPIQLSDIYSVNLIKANVECAMGKLINLTPLDNNGFYMTHVLHTHSDGIFEDVDFDPMIDKYIYRKVVYKKPGDKVFAFDGAGKALGIIFMKFSSKEIMTNVAVNIDELIKIRLK